MVQVRDLVIGGGDFAVESPQTSISSGQFIAADMGAALEAKMQRDADAYNIKAETDLQLFGAQALQDTINAVDNPDEITGKFFDTYKTKYEQLLQAAPNQRAKDGLSKIYENLRGAYGQRAISAQAQELQSYRLNSLYESIEMYQSAAVNGTIPYSLAQQGIRDAIGKSQGFLSPSEAAKVRRTTKQETAKLIVSNMTDDERFKAMSSATADIKGGFEAAMQMVHANEGGYAASDGASGQPVMMGINKGSHPKAFDEIMRINQTQGPEAAKAYADKFYKENYWDKNKIGELPENVQTIVMDGVINHWSGFQRELVQAARNGASPEELIQMRRREYERLANEPGENGDYPWRASAEAWENRMDNLEAGLFGKTGTAIDDLDIADKVRVRQDVQRYVAENEKLKATDYGEYARRNGIDVPTAVAQQAGRPYVQVVPNEQAKAIVSELKKYQNVDDFINFSKQFKQQYAGGEIPAVQNLVQNGLEPEMSTAMMMAVKNPNQYYSHIEAIFNWKNNTDLVKQNLSDRGERENDIEIAVSKIWDDSDQRLAMEKKYGKGRPDELKKAMQAAAKGYMAFNPSASKDDAAKFAAKPFLEEYKVGKIRGQVFNVPLGADAAQAERRLEKFYKKKLVPLYGENFKLDFISPVLNDTEDGFYFVDPLYNRKKLPNSQQDLTVSFGELLNFEPTPNVFEQRAVRKIDYKQSSTPNPSRVVK